MRFRFFTAILFALLSFAAFGQFDLLSALPDVPEVTPQITPGAWVEYMIKDNDGNAQKMKFSIISQEKEDDIEYYWFELKTTDQEGKWSIFKFKSTDPKNKEAAVSLIIQIQGEQPRQMDFMLPSNRPVAKGAETEPVEEIEIPEVEIDVKKDVTIEVAAGKFKCDKYTITDEEGKTEIWISPEIPIAGVVRAIREGEGLTELTKYGEKGAKSEVSGATQSIELPKLPDLKRLLKKPE
ncbi:hypothetical protein KAH81_06245 [bacterium]|nr:hypothetical protein [bacterium]